MMEQIVRINLWTIDDVNLCFSVPFPTPMEEQRDDLPCTYLGCVYVEKPTGIDVLRAAIERVSTTVPQEKWIRVTVNLSPSSLTIITDNVSILLTSRSSFSISFDRNPRINYSIVEFVIYHFLVLVKIPGRKSSFFSAHLYLSSHVVFVESSSIAQIILSNVMFFIVSHHVSNCVKTSKLLAK